MPVSRGNHGTVTARSERRIRAARIHRLVDQGCDWEEIAAALKMTPVEVQRIALFGRSVRRRESRAGDEQRLDFLRRARKEVPVHLPLTMARYDNVRESDAPSSQTVLRRFGRWPDALQLAGIDHELDVPTRRRWSDDELLVILSWSGCASIRSYDAWADVQSVPLPHSSTIVKRFRGIGNALRLIGRAHDPSAAVRAAADRNRWPESDLLAAVRRSGEVTMSAYMRWRAIQSTPRAYPTAEAISRRWGGWRAALERANGRSQDAHAQTEQL
jgi:hypothetical protein